MNRKIFFFFFAFFVLPFPAQGASWGPNGHPHITYNVATSPEFGLPQDLSKVMALGSTAPDYFEFENLSAHSQTPNPPLTKEGRLIVSPAVYEQMQKEAFQKSEKWHDFYLNQAAEAMKKGHRERAAFLLGYALHNSADYATHGGMPNLLHSGKTLSGKNPDQNFRNLKAAHEMTALDLSEFRRKVGEKNWRLFRGESVREPGHLGSEVPEPLLNLGNSLSRWNPNSGIIPLTSGKNLASLGYSLLSKVEQKIQTVFPAYKPELQGTLKESARVQMENFLFGLYSRQKEMLEYLSLPYPAGDQTLYKPAEKDMDQLLEYLYLVTDFEKDGKNYENLPPEEKKILEDHLIWKKLTRERLETLRAHRKSLREAYLAALMELKKLKEELHSRIFSCEEEKKKVQAQMEKWQAKLQNNPPSLAQAPPQKDARPVEPVLVRERESPSNSQPAQNRNIYNSSENEHKYRNREFNSPTYNYLKLKGSNW